MKKILSSFIIIICSLLLSSCSYNKIEKKFEKELELLRGYKMINSDTDFVEFELRECKEVYDYGIEEYCYKVRFVDYDGYLLTATIPLTNIKLTYGDKNTISLCLDDFETLILTHSNRTYLLNTIYITLKK